MENRRRSETKMKQYQIGVTILSPKAVGRRQIRIFTIKFLFDFGEFDIMAPFLFHFDGNFPFTPLISLGFQ